MKKINLFQLLVSKSDEASHKRFLSLSSFIVLLIILILDCFGIKVTLVLVYVFAGLCAGNTTLSVIEKLLKK